MSALAFYRTLPKGRKAQFTRIARAFSMAHAEKVLRAMIAKAEAGKRTAGQ